VIPASTRIISVVKIIFPFFISLASRYTVWLTEPIRTTEENPNGGCVCFVAAALLFWVRDARCVGEAHFALASGTGLFCRNRCRGDKTHHDRTGTSALRDELVNRSNSLDLRTINPNSCSVATAFSRRPSVASSMSLCCKEMSWQVMSYILLRGLRE